MLKVSIVTISFNQGEFLERTMQSVFAQDYPNIEYILVDPGSADQSREIIGRYAARCAHVILEPDAGPSDGLNKGFAASSGEIFGFLNSDDILYPGAVSAAVEHFQRNPEVDVVSGHAKVIDANDRVLRLTYSDKMTPLRDLYSSAVLIQPSTFFRRSAFQRSGGFNVENRACWDGELFSDMVRAGCRFSRSDLIWSGFRIHRQSITASKRLEAEAQESKEVRFRTATGRARNPLDQATGAVLRVWKHVTNPRDTLQRILRGPVYGRLAG